MTLPLLLAGLAAPAAAAEPLTAEKAIEHYREVFVPAEQLDCPRSADPEEILVCGRKPGARDPDRLPLPVERVAGERVRMLPGESPGGVAAMSADRCISRCPQPLKVDIIKAIKVGGKIVDHLLHPD
jgi:hypothetical protein